MNNENGTLHSALKFKIKTGFSNTGHIMICGSGADVPIDL